MLNFDPYCEPTKHPGDHDLNKPESTLLLDAFIHVSAFLADWFLEDF